MTLSYILYQLTFGIIHIMHKVTHVIHNSSDRKNLTNREHGPNNYVLEYRSMTLTISASLS